MNRKLLEIFAPSSRKRRRTKIVCTLGPATTSRPMITRLIRRGMDCARLNFSHGDLQHHLQTIKTVRQISEDLGRFVAIMQDLPGPKIRVGKIPDGSMSLKRGQIVYLAGDSEQPDKETVPVHNLNLARYVPVGSMVFLADGTIRLETIGKTRDRLECRCLNSGTLLSGKGINIPKIQKNFRSFTELDKRYLKFGLEHKVDLVAVSFVRAASDMDRVREFVKARSPDPPWIIAKIERREAVENASSVVKSSDAVMVARGDLGVENPLEQVPVMQKLIIAECNRRAIPVITATQMLESMVQNPRPTRAETTDVANAIFDGTDAVMLSEETAVGSYPVECVKVLDHIARVAENWIRLRTSVKVVQAPSGRDKGLSQAATRLANQIGSKFIVCSTDRGLLAMQLARERPPVEIIGITQNKTTANRLKIVRGIVPLFAEEQISSVAPVERIEKEVSKILVRNGIANRGDKIVFAREEHDSQRSELLLSFAMK